MEKLRVFKRCRVLQGRKLIATDLYVAKGKVVAAPSDLSSYLVEEIDCGGKILTPGFIDIQNNGCFGKDFTSDADIAESIAVARKRLLETGCTGFCPTLITSKADVYVEKLSKIVIVDGSASAGAAVLGVHLEGPLIHEKYRGCHRLENLRSMSEFEPDAPAEEILRAVYGDVLSCVSIITLDASQPGIGRVVRALAEQGIIVNVGHTAATLAQTECALKHGASGITHLYNAQPSFTAEEPGVIGALVEESRGLQTKHKLPLALARAKQLTVNRHDRVFYGIIADTIHVSPAALKLAHALNPEGLCLITDAIAAMGLGEGVNHIADIEVEVTRCNGVLKAVKKGTDVLAGVAASINECIRYFVRLTGVPLSEALTYASEHPARYLGIEGFKGRLEVGYDADFAMIDDDVNVIQTWVGGELAYSKP